MLAGFPNHAFSAFARRFPIIQPILVQWGDMDAFQHVNNVQYYKYFETARMAHVQELVRVVPPGDTFDSNGFLKATAIGPILAASSCVFKLPVVYPDLLFAGSSILGATSASDSENALVTTSNRFTMDFALYSVRANRMAATGQGHIVLYDYQAKKKASSMPVGLLAAIKLVEQRAAARTESDIEALVAQAEALAPMWR